MNKINKAPSQLPSTNSVERMGPCHITRMTVKFLQRFEPYAYGNKKQNGLNTARGGGGTSLWVRRGCAPVLGSFWPENSGIGVSFYWKISVIGVFFHSEFSGIGDYCYTQVLYKFSSNAWSVSGELISSIFVLKNVLRSGPRSNGHLEPKYSLPALNP